MQSLEVGEQQTTHKASDNRWDYILISLVWAVMVLLGLPMAGQWRNPGGLSAVWYFTLALTVSLGVFNFWAYRRTRTNIRWIVHLSWGVMLFVAARLFLIYYGYTGASN